MRPTWLRSLLIVLSILYGKLLMRMENTRFWVEDLLVHGGKAGHVQFNCHEDDADGVVRWRSLDAYGRPTITGTTFRMANRWPLSGRRRLSGLVLLDIHSQAQLAGMNPVNLMWLRPPCLRWRVTTLDVQRVDACPMLAQRTARMGQFHARLARWFPSPPPPDYNPRDHWDMIIKRL